MGSVIREYTFGGLDTRTNKLYRKDGSASDCRNVLLDSNRRLVKVKDREALNVPRGADGETGEFLDKLPFTAIIIDAMPFEDYIVIATKIPYGSPVVIHHVNKFYKYFEDSNTVEFIPFEMETYNDPNLGQILNKVGSDTDGKFTQTNQENILLFMGHYSDSTRSDTFPVSTLDAEIKDLGALYYYDGEVIGFAGVQSNIKDSTLDLGTQVSENYVRLLPFKVDMKGRPTFGNYSTHLTTGTSYDLDIPFYSDTLEKNILLDNAYDYTAYCRLQANVNLLESNDIATRTISVDIYNRSSEYHSVAKGQYLYGVLYQDVQTPFPTPTRSVFQYTIYRAFVEDVDYVASTVTLHNFSKYNKDSGLWESSAEFRADWQQAPYLSNVLIAMYQSKDFAFGHTFAGYTTWGYDGTNILSTTPLGDPASGYTLWEVQQPLLFISEDFDDIYDVESVKQVPPRGKQVIDYLSALLIIDEDFLYFSDFSVGGTIENFTPFDNFSVGSSKRGKISGVFANETFICVMREEEAYYITGNIFLANYRIQSYQSTRIGCTSPTSIIDFRGAGMFLSKRGFYMCQQGGVMPELSDKIETIFTDGALSLDLDLTDCKALVDFQSEYIHFHIASNTAESGYVLSYSYYHNEWYLLDNIDGSGAFDIINGNIYSSDGEDLYKTGSDRKEAAAYYRSNFNTLGKASFEKKFLQALLYTMDMPDSFAINLKTYKNWITSEAETDEVKSGDVGQVDLTQRFNPQRVKSMAIEINSDSGNVLTLNGYEYEVQDDVRMFKNDDNS